MTTAREIMTAGAECAKTSETLADVAKKMRELDVGMLPICGDDDRLKGTITVPEERVGDLVEAISSARANN